MNYLRVFLCAVYAILIALLLLNNCEGCKRQQPAPEQRVPDAVVVDTTIARPVPDTTNVDTTAVEEAERVGQSGKLKVTLLWDFPADIDLHVIQPNGVEIAYNHRVDNSTRAHLDVDNRRGGSGAAENIFWDAPDAGAYKVFLKYYSASKPGGIRGSGTCRVVIFKEGQEPQTFEVGMNNVGEKKDITTFTM